MYSKLLISLALLVSTAYSRKGNFRLISFGDKNELKIHKGKKYNLTAVEGDDLLYGITLDNLPEDTFKYYYIVDGQSEGFYRSFDVKANTTHNEFYGRKETLKSLKTFKHPASLPNWNRSIGRTNLFDESYIPTVHLTGNNTEKLFHDPYSFDNITLENVKIYLKDTVESFDEVVSKPKNRGFEKFQIKLKLGKNKNKDTIGTNSKGKGIHGRHVFKLRNGGEDPLNLRQLIYGNIIEALGMPSLHSVMVRLYYNKKPMGFYTLQEDVTTNSFLKNEFYGDPETQTNNAPKNLGYVLDGTTGSDFEYKPDDEEYYAAFDHEVGENRDRLIALCKAIHELDTSDEKALQEFESQWFDIDTFHKAMAMEYLTGDWDGYWYTTSNFAVYDDPLQSTKDTYKFYFITQDHDETFGVGLTNTINKVGKKFPEQSYTTMLNRTWHIAEDDAKYRTLVDKFIASTPSLHKRFQETLAAVVENIFNPVVFRDVVSTYYNRYKPEVKWDFSIERVYHPVIDESPGYTYQDFKNNFEKKVGGLRWGLYEWVSLRAEAIKKELCITWKGDENPPSKDCVPSIKL
ncbi:hypothetical protein LY90DRAFT_705548 [Neocallimastix californiae]|jgi:hypothetical protein|uniref:Coth-domain-containing protein n=1 Tax=Neocallimastix californiae TaxID=1754190 RepID=A0A1Y2B3H7_9FUNG|nr:hypothetical protein LY90DRAFT_705548 [Neocallimastix californiae]|eukprot:ORY29392.1 hypothetical protein LY90DRAFT_705548 [Neocallimastix californiae]